MLIREFTNDDIQKVLKFTDNWIGRNYFSKQELEDICDYSSSDGLNASFVAESDGEVVAARLSYAPGKWTSHARGLSFDLWECEKSEVGYFKSLFVSGQFQGRGLGRELSTLSIDRLKKMGARAIVCHSWLESPGNSSQRYLKKMGFREVKRYPNFWFNIDYECTKCAPSRCECTAAEMIKYL